MRRLLAATAVVALALTGCSSEPDPLLEGESTETDAMVGEDETGEPIEQSPTETTTEVATATDTETAAATETASEGEGGVEATDLATDLTGDAEVPGPGDPAASGSFTGTLTPLEASAELCYTLEAVGVSSEPTAAHIHQGGPDEAGPVVLSLTVPTDGPVEECVDVEAGLADQLFTDASGFYVNVHSDQHPDGAVRGQLTTA